MSVQTFIYPRDLASLSIERLLPAVRKLVSDVAITQLQLKKRRKLDWSSVTFCHPSAPDVEMLFVVGQNTKSQLVELTQRYDKAKEFSVVRDAPLTIWAQYKALTHQSLRQFEQTSRKFGEILAGIASLSDAIIWSPENDRLFTVAAFRRHIRKHRSV